MAGKWDGKVCPVCGEGVLHDSERVQASLYRGHRFESVEAGAFCDKCHDGIVYPDRASEQRWNDFRERVDKEICGELVSIRKRLNLTQGQAASFTGGGHNAFSRYERGDAKPMDAVLHLMRILNRHPELLSMVLPSVQGTHAVAAFKRVHTNMEIAQCTYGPRATAVSTGSQVFDAVATESDWLLPVAGRASQRAN